MFVQAFTPFHPAIQYARRHDFVGFYEQEIEFRNQLNYPPFSRVALLTLRGHNEDKVKFSAEHVRKELDKLIKGGEPLSLALSPSDGERVAEGRMRGGFKDLRIAGPAPAPLLRAENFYRYQLMLRTTQMNKLSLALAPMIAGLKLPEDVTLTVDVDPASLS